MSKEQAENNSSGFGVDDFQQRITAEFRENNGPRRPAGEQAEPGVQVFRIRGCTPHVGTAGLVCPMSYV